MSLQKSRNGNECPECGDTYRCVVHENGRTVRYPCRCSVTVVECFETTEPTVQIETDDNGNAKLSSFVAVTDGGRKS